MPEYRAKMTSGSAAATFSKPISEAVPTISALPSPSSSRAHAQVAESCSPNHSVTPTGTTPSAKTESWSVRPTVTTRSGRCSIVVSPYLCAIVTGNGPPFESVGPPFDSAGSDPQPAVEPMTNARTTHAHRRRCPRAVTA
jgi:hypothetical protein